MISIKEFIESKLSLNKNGKQFINSLFNGDNDEKRLLACIGIDIKHNLLDLHELESIINSINLSAYPKTSLLEIYDKHTDNNSYTISLIKSIKKERFARIMKLSPFVEFFYNPNIENDFKESINENDFIEEINRGNLENFEMQNESIGKHKLVWVTTLDDLMKILNSSDKPTNEIVSRLGLGIPFDENGILVEETEYVYFEYPDSFDEFTYQPTHLCKYWNDENNLFLSFMNIDKYGRTRSNQGDYQKKRMKEVVHFPLTEKKYSYNIKYLGKFNDSYIKNISYIEAKDRYYE